MRRASACFVTLFLFAVVHAAVVSSADAQTLLLGSIHGRVVDSSGSVVPGVTVTLTSPALLASATAVTDATGNYKFEQLPIGIYKLVFQLEGFQELIRENIQLSVGFSAEVNITIQVGQLTQTVTVSALGPVVDTTTTTPSTTIAAPVLRDELPVTRKMQEVVAATPGVMPSGVPDLGGGTISGGGWQAYGLAGSNTSLIEGIDSRQSTTAPGDNYNMDALDEFQVIGVGANAQVGGPGVALIALSPSGGNRFHGRMEGRFQHDTPWLEGSNLSDALKAQGLSAGIAERILNTQDLGANIGGPVMKDKWWFFVAGHLNNSHRSVFGYVNPDGSPANAHTLLSNQTIKTTYQVSRTSKFIGFFDRFGSLYQDRNASALVPKENTLDQTNNPRNWKAEWQSVPNSHLALDFFAGEHHYLLEQTAQPDPTGKPTTMDLTTLLNTGPSTAQDHRFRTSYQYVGSLTYAPGGGVLHGHEFNGGFRSMIMSQGTNQPTAEAGNYRLIFQNSTPVQFQVFNFPVTGNVTSLDETGIYLTDTWHIHQRVTLNLGIRGDFFHTFVPAQTKVASEFGPPWTSSAPFTGVSADYAYQATGNWTAAAPRLGASWNIFGDGKTVLRASYGRYNWSPGDDWAANFNGNGAYATTFTWHDNGDHLYEPGEVNLDPNGKDFVSVSAGSSGGSTAIPNIVLNPNLKEQHTNEYVTQLERELGQGFSAKVGFVYAGAHDIWTPIPYLIPYSAWNRPVQVFDPGQKGTPGVTQGGPAITLYDLDPAYKGVAFSAQQYVNSPNPNTFKTIELGANKRLTSRWSMLASYTATKNHRWIVPIVTNPNQNYFPVDDTWAWQTTISGNYNLPIGFDLSATFQSYNGLQGQRSATYVSPRVAIPGAGRIVVPMEAYGSSKGDVRSLLNLKVAHKIRGARVFVEVLNTLNNNSAWAINFNSGSSFGVVSQIPNPRIARLGASLSW